MCVFVRVFVCLCVCVCVYKLVFVARVLLLTDSSRKNAPILNVLVRLATASQVGMEML